jgi:hypothetical protein
VLVALPAMPTQTTATGCFDESGAEASPADDEEAMSWSFRSVGTRRWEGVVLYGKSSSSGVV